MTAESLFGPLMTAWAEHEDAIDGQLGICTIPVIDMSADEVENVKLSPSIDSARELLSRHGIWEYFFPKASDLALGFIDRGLSIPDKIEEGIALAPRQGHPLADPHPPSIDAVLDFLKSRGLVVEGELGFDTTVEGAEVRAQVKFKPKESLFVKLKNLMTLAPLLKYFHH